MKFNIILLISIIVLFGCHSNRLIQNQTNNDSPAKILFICTSVAEVNAAKNGTFLSEIAEPFILLRAANYEIDIVSPKGGEIPIYYKFDTTEVINRALESTYYQDKINGSLQPEEVNSKEYTALVIPGGYGQFWDIHTNAAINKIIADIYENNGIIGALGHGTSSLANVKLSNGEYLIKGKTLTCFPSWFEKERMFEADYGKLLPFDMETELRKNGANLKPVDKETRSNSQIVDKANKIITASSATGGEFIASELIKIIEAKKRAIEIDYQKDLIPEGIVLDIPSNKLYLSSIHKKKITETDIKSGQTKDLIKSEEHGYKSGVGLEIKNNKLFALSGGEKDGKTISNLLVIDLTNNQNTKTYKLLDTVSHFMNDLAISDENEIYITDTKRHCVYKLNYPEGEIELFIEDEQIKHPNGITISDDNERLYVDSWSDGVRIIDISTQKILNEKHDLTSKIGIDGMKYYNGNLYAIRNGSNDGTKHGLIKIKLSDGGEEITGIEPLLMNHPLMNVPTTIDIVDGTIYILANSQMDNLSQETNEINDKDKLTKT